MPSRDPVALTTEVLRRSRTDSWSPVAGAVAPVLAGAGLPAGLRRRPAPGAPVEEVLRSRVSVRHFAADPVGQDDLEAVLAAGAEVDRACWPGEWAAGNGLALVAVAWRVDDLAPGAYLLGDGLQRVGDVPTGPAARRTVLQPEYADSPALCLVFGNLAAALERHGDHGYRQLLVRGGAAAHTGWLTALGRGLVGGVFAGFLADAARSFTGRSDATARQLLALALGRPPDPSGRGGGGSTGLP